MNRLHRICSAPHNITRVVRSVWFFSLFLFLLFFLGKRRVNLLDVFFIELHNIGDFTLRVQRWLDPIPIPGVSVLNTRHDNTRKTGQAIFHFDAEIEGVGRLIRLRQVVFGLGNDRKIWSINDYNIGPFSFSFSFFAYLGLDSVTKTPVHVLHPEDYEPLETGNCVADQ